MKIPVEIVNGIILLKASIDGIDGHVALDTGAMKTCLNKVHFPDLSGKEREVYKFDNEIKENSAVEGICTIQCHEWSLPKTSVLLFDMSYVEKPLRKMNPHLKFLGVIGIDHIKKHRLFLDYENSYIALDEEAPKGLSYFGMNSDILPIIEIEVFDQMHPFVLDTGANTCLLDKSLNTDALKTIDETNGIVQIPKIIAFGCEYHDVTAVIHNIDDIRSKVSVSGVIGYQVLSNRISFFDFDKGRIGIK